MEERPAAEVVISTIQQFLNSCPQSAPLCDLLQPCAGQADLGVELSLSLSQASVEDSSIHVTQAAIDEETGT